MTNIDLDQIIPPDMPEWFYQDAGEWKFNLPCECMDQECRSGIFLCNLPAKHPIRFLAGSLMMTYWREKFVNDNSCFNLAELAEIIKRESIQEELLDSGATAKLEEYSDNYDAAREWRDGKGE